MPKIDQTSTVNLAELIARNKTNQTHKAGEGMDIKDFGDTIADFISTVNANQKAAGQQVTDIIEGKSQNLHEAMAVMQEAKLSFELMLEIRNKLLESYQEIQRMQV